MEEERKIPLYYCNIMQLEASDYDFNFKFGIKKKRNEPVSEEDFDFSVIMSPQHAKRLLMALNDVLVKYENAFGPINIKDAPTEKE
jgi:hypothetical protein